MALKITFETDEIAEYLRIEPDQEIRLVETLKNSAMNEAEEFLNTDFAGQEAPALVKEWVLNRIGEKYENRGMSVKPDFSSINKHRIYSFKALDTLSDPNSVMKQQTVSETSIVNGTDQ